MSDNKPTHYKGFTIKHNAPMTDEYYVVGSLSFYKTVDDAKRSIDGLLGNDTPTSLEAIIEVFYRNYETDMAAVVPPFGQITDIKEQQRQSEHFWNKRMKEAIAAITALLPEKFEPERDSMGDKYLTDTKYGWNNAIDTIQGNFTGQTDNEREQ